MWKSFFDPGHDRSRARAHTKQLTMTAKNQEIKIFSLGECERKWKTTVEAKEMKFIIFRHDYYCKPSWSARKLKENLFILSLCDVSRWQWEAKANTDVRKKRFFILFCQVGTIWIKICVCELFFRSWGRKAWNFERGNLTF